MAPKAPILVTGASGFVGDWVCHDLVGRGWGVVAVGGGRLPEVAGARGVVLDLTDGGAVSSLLAAERPAAVIHCAGITTVAGCEGDPEGSRRVNVGATENLLAALGGVEGKPPLLFCSTDLVFDGSEAPYMEDAAPKPLHHYGSQKVEAEGAVLAHGAGTVVRLALVYGAPARFKGSFLSWMVGTLAAGKPLTLFEDEWRTPVWVGDVAAAFSALLEAPRQAIAGRIFHAAGAERLTRLEIGERLCDVSGLDRGLILPTRRGQVPGGGQRARDVSLGTEALRELRWQPTPLEEALLQCREAWQEHH